MLVPLSMALITDYDDDYMGVGEPPEQPARTGKRKSHRGAKS